MDVASLAFRHCSPWPGGHLDLDIGRPLFRIRADRHTVYFWRTSQEPRRLAYGSCQIVAQCGQHFPTYRPAYRDIYYKDRKTGGGAVQDAMTHVLNTGEWMVGPIDRLIADAAHQVLEGVEVEDTVHVLTRQGNVLGSYSLNQYQAANDWTLTVVCREGTVRFEGQHLRWRWMTKPEEPWHDEPVEPFERDFMFISQANAFLDALEGKVEVWSTLDDGLQTLRCNLAVLASADDPTGWQMIEQ